MTREEAIAILETFVKKPLFSDEYKQAFNIAIHDIKQYHDWAINNLMLINKENYEPAEQESRWIPVSERLPEERIEVLTCSNGGFIEIQSLEESYGGYWENQKGDWSDVNEVIAWMPLPEPYKAESEETDADSN